MARSVVSRLAGDSEVDGFVAHGLVEMEQLAAGSQHGLEGLDLLRVHRLE